MTAVLDLLAARDALRELIALEEEGLERYQAAGDKLEELDTKVALESFRVEHAGAGRELRGFLEQRQSFTPSVAPSAEPLEGKNPILQPPPDERMALTGLSRLERELEAAYVGLLERGDIEPSLRELLERVLAQARARATWIDDQLLAENNRA
ncbi:MAG TPA: ferritin-like domain-containing protein [Polyangiaceae bacterium]|jgi:hypothetical protein